MRDGDRRLKTSRRSKLVAIDEAVGLLRQSDYLALGGIWSQNGPSALVREAIRQGASDLVLSAAPAAGFAVDLCFAAGLVSRGYLPNVTLEHLGLAPGFRGAVESGAIDLVECDESTLIGGYRAAAAGLPFTPIVSLAGSQLASVSPWLQRTIRGDVEVFEAPPLAPDVVFLHAQEADIFGNVRQVGTVFADRLMAKAASRAVVVSVDRVVSNEEIRRDPRATTIPGYLVTHVVEAPFGAHPCASHGRYVADEAHIRHYVDAVNGLRKESPEAWQRYRSAYLDLDGHDAYIAACGGHSELLLRLGEGRHR